MIDPRQQIAAIFEDFRLDAHVPGLVYGVVHVDGGVSLGATGVQDLIGLQPVTSKTVFRIASMSKVFTALTVLHLRDQGLLRLEAPAADYVAELRGWSGPTVDAPQIRVRDLLNHCAGLVTDDPWGDRQNPLPEADFSALLAQGVPMTRAPGSGYEYSNLGYALLGRIIANVTGQPFAQMIDETLLTPLAMRSSGFEPNGIPAERAATGYRWEDGRWQDEPVLGHGAFSAMGGLLTNAEDYARWLQYLLSAWPARDAPDTGPVRRSTVRELAQGSGFPRYRPRPAGGGSAVVLQAAAYGMGLDAAEDPDLGFTLSHGGGYPGYGSHMLLMPERGVGVFALANRTYAGPAPSVWDAAMCLLHAGSLPVPRAPAISDVLAEAYRSVLAIYAKGSLEADPAALAMNFLLDRSAAGWADAIARCKAEVGECLDAGSLMATGLLSGEFVWRCSHGRVRGSLTLAPTQPPRIQALSLRAIHVTP
jgi:CubicO group peptidase (beta-lactamase class C family)